MEKPNKFNNIWFKIAASTSYMTYKLGNLKEEDSNIPSIEKYYINTPLQAIIGLIEGQCKEVVLEMGRKEELNAG